MTTTTRTYLCHPSGAAGITRASSGSTAFSWSGYTEVVAANAINATFYIAGLTWCWHTPMAAADTTYSWEIALATGAAGAETDIIVVPASARADTLVGYVTSMFVTLPEPKEVEANTRVAVRVNYSLATTSNSLTAIKIFYSR